MTMSTFNKALTIGTIALAFAVGCETAADQQRKANEAQDEANRKAERAQEDADRTAQKAQADANREIADAQEKFSKMREEYRHDLQSKLVEVDKEIAELRTQAATETGKKKQQIDANLPIIDERRTRLSEAFRELEQASATTWDRAKGEVEKRWDELKHSVESAT